MLPAEVARRQRILQLIGNLESAVELEGVMEESIGDNRLSRLPQFQRAERNIARGMVGGENRESELRDSKDDKQTLYDRRPKSPAAVTLNPESESEQCRHQHRDGKHKAGFPVPSIILLEKDGRR